VALQAFAWIRRRTTETSAAPAHLWRPYRAAHEPAYLGLENQIRRRTNRHLLGYAMEQRPLPEKDSADALKVAQLRRLAGRTGSVVAKAGYLALAEAIERSCLKADLSNQAN
jgi:hypothetical protein